MGAYCTKTQKKSSSKYLKDDYDVDSKLRKIATLNENLEKNFPKGAYYYNKQELK